MKLLIITQKYDFNDSNLGVFIGWWDRIAQRMEKVYILALEKKSEPVKSNIEVISIGKEKGVGFLRKIINFYAGAFKTIGKIDAILVHMIPKYAILIAPIAFIYGKPVYMWYTGVSAHWQLKFAVKFCKKIFTAHEAAMRVNTSKRIITGHGIDIGKFQILSSKFQVLGPIVILSIGRITPSKGHDLIVGVFSDLTKQNYNLNLKIIGGVIQKHHEDYYAKLKLLADSNVDFLGNVAYQNMSQYFDKAHILINAVPFGGLDKVVLEAMASGVLPLTSNSAFLNVFPELFASQLIFKEGNSEDLKDKLKNILDKKLYLNKILINDLRNAVIRNHNLDNLIEKIIKEMKE